MGYLRSKDALLVYLAYKHLATITATVKLKLILSLKLDSFFIVSAVI